MKQARVCALCNRRIEGEAVDFNGLAVCGAHADEMGTYTWGPVGHYRSDIVGKHRKSLLSSNGLRSLLLRVTDPPGHKLFVLDFEKERACQVFSSMRKNVIQCSKCMTEFIMGGACCPECGLKPQHHPPSNSS